MKKITNLEELIAETGLTSYQALQKEDYDIEGYLQTRKAHLLNEQAKNATLIKALKHHIRKKELFNIEEDIPF